MKQFLSVLFCLSLLLTAVSCAPTSRAPQATQVSQTTQPPQSAYGAYDDIVSQYTALLTAKHNGEALPAPSTEGMDERERAIAEVLYGIADGIKDAEAAERLGYGYKDLDGNGTSELILLTQYTTILAIFTVSDNKPILRKIENLRFAC